MGACRDCLGKLSYTVKTGNGVFSVTKGENRIVRHYPYCRTDARIDTRLVVGGEILPFDSFIRAARFMAENKDALI